ncbi:MAG: hypothetical protein IKS31_05185 [Clostridia bacterium]|nr:hypothetical protein [Clostridia bacterium]
MKHPTATRPRVRLAAAAAVLCFLLTGCAARDTGSAPSVTTFAPAERSLPSDTPVPGAEQVPSPPAELTEVQRNSVTMLNWLACLTQEISASSASRLYLEEVYSLIVNETYPNAIDGTTQKYLSELRKAIADYRLITVQRDHAAFLHDQAKSKAMSNALKAAFADLSGLKVGEKVSKAGTWAEVVPALKESLLKLATPTAVFTIAKAISTGFKTYNSATAQADIDQLQESWKLDLQSMGVFDGIRSKAFDYMIDIVREYGLPGSLTLTENAVAEFVSWKNNDNPVRRIQFLESNADTYRAFGSYWLLLAQSYYENGEWAKCLQAVSSYESLSTRIFRHDLEYARILPLAIAAAGEAVDDRDYVATVSRYADAILSNTGNADWDLRLYAARTYTALYAATFDRAYLEKAYKVVSDNVNTLVDGQAALNKAYLANLKTEAVPAGATDAQKKQIAGYNSMLNRNRGAELPPVSEPFLLNLQMLLELADTLGVSEEERSRIANVVRPGGAPIFLTGALEARYSIPAGKTYAPKISTSGVSFNGTSLIIPAEWVTDGATVSATIRFTDGSVSGSIALYLIRVSRGNPGNLSTFRAVYFSDKLSDITQKGGIVYSFIVRPCPDRCDDAYTFRFKTVDTQPSMLDRLLLPAKDRFRYDLMN